MEGDTLIIARPESGRVRSPRANAAGAARRQLCRLALLTACWFAVPHWRHVAADDIQVATATTHEAITVAADSCTRWREGVYDVWHLQGNCYLNQGLTYARGPEAVIWVDSRNGLQGPTKVIAYFESAEGAQVAVDFRRADGKAGKDGVLGQQRGSTWFQRLETSAPLVWKLPAAGAPAQTPEIYQRGLEQFNPERRRQLLLAQYTEFAPSAAGGQELPPGMIKYSVHGRSDVYPNVESNPTPDGGRVSVVSGGVRVLVEGLSAGDQLPPGFGPLGVIDLSTDRAVIWSGAGSGPAGGVQSKDAPLEIYMEGNIEFRQGDRIVYADRMYYDVRRQIGVILNAELLTPLPALNGYQYPGLVRLKAQAIQQLDASHFSATNALVTTSRLEEPAYDFSSQQINFTDIEQPVVDPITGAPLLAPDGSPATQRQQLAEAQGNVLHLRGWPVFYWPTIATDLQKPSFLIDRVRLGNDNVFGTQLMVDYDAYQLFGVRNRPQGTDWHLSTDYLSERGFGFGTDFEYDRPEIFGFVGPAQGTLDFWAINDSGLDNLGLGRQTIQPEKDFRFRLFGNHRQRLENGWEVTAESGWISDRTFLEQYFEQEWDELKDPRTGVRGRRIDNNREWMIEANGQVNSFFSETEFLPRLDHYWIGQSLLDDRLTWFEHSSASYARFNVATPPSEPTLLAQYSVLPWESNSEGERLFTRQEINAPIQAGAVKINPYAGGELYHIGEDLAGASLDRLYGYTGIKASLPMWATYPNIRDPLFNLNGLAHKVVFETDFFYADANQNFDELPLYDPLDDISILEFRRRLMSGALPPTITDPKFDPRRFALRQGIHEWVTSPSPEVADDLMALRMGVRQRWQTKRGVEGNQHIVDWLTLDMNATYFPEADRDNFGQELGLLDYDLRWHLGDRFTIVSDGFADVFGDGLKTISAGVLLNRPTNGNAFLGLRSINGPVTSNVLMSSYSYRLSEKWITSASASYDFENQRNIGQTMSFTRIGESMLVTVGLNVDASKNNVGVNFLVEPRVFPNLRLTKTTGIEVPPAGAMGLE